MNAFIFIFSQPGSREFFLFFFQNEHWRVVAAAPSGRPRVTLWGGIDSVTVECRRNVAAINIPWMRSRVAAVVVAVFPRVLQFP